MLVAIFEDDISQRELLSQWHGCRIRCAVFWKGPSATPLNGHREVRLTGARLERSRH